MDSVMSPETAIQLGQFGGLGVLDLEGLWTRYENPTPLLEEIARLDPKDVHHRIREIYSEPIKPGLIRERITQLREAGVVAAGSLSPQRTQEHWKSVVDAGVDIFFIRGTTVSAEHVSGNREPLNLKRFIYELDVPVIVGGCATYTAALHLMRTGAAGVLVGFGGGASQTTWETLGISARTCHRGSRRRLSLGQRGTPPHDAARAPCRGRPGRATRADPVRPRPFCRWHHEPRRRASPRDGDDRLHGPQGVPARRGRDDPLIPFTKNGARHCRRAPFSVR